MLIFDHIEGLDTLAKDSYRARTGYGRMLLEVHICALRD